MKLGPLISSAGLIAISGCSSLVTYEGHSYQYIDDSVSWDTARRLAEDAGGYLAYFETKKELEYVQAHQTRRLTAWVGLTDAESEGNWKWINGVELAPPMIGSLETGIDLGYRDYGHILLQGGFLSRGQDGALPRGWKGYALMPANGHFTPETGYSARLVLEGCL